MKFLAPLRVFFHLPYRQEEGFVQALSKFVPGSSPGLTLSSTGGFLLSCLSSSLPDLEEEVVIALDSSGIKVTNRGEWVRELWNRKSKKEYLKIHLAVDVETKQILLWK